MNELKKLVVFLKDVDAPVGDLCTDILRTENFPFENAERAFMWLYFKSQTHPHIKKSVRDLKKIYKIIMNMDYTEKFLMEMLEEDDFRKKIGMEKIDSKEYHLKYDYELYNKLYDEDNRRINIDDMEKFVYGD